MAIVNVTSFDLLVFEWTIFEQNIETNTSMIHWNMYLNAGSYGAISSSASKAWSVTIDGTTYSGTNTVGIGNNETKLLASGAKMILHNADGTKTFSYSFSQEFNITFSGKKIETITGSGTDTLTAIPRAATIISAPNFTESDSPTITYSNPAGDKVIALQACISIVGGSGGDDIPYRDIPVNGTSYTFNLTTAEMATLRNAVKSGNSIQVRFYVLTNLGGTLYPSYITRTFSLNNASPIIGSFTAEDTSTQALALTGNKYYWIKGISDVHFSFQATGQSGATIATYSASCGNETIGSAYGTFTNVSTNVINATVTDSRGNTASSTFSPVEWIDYNGLTCTMTQAQLDVDGTLKFTATGVYFMGSFGATSNSLNMYYRYRLESASEYGEWTTLPLVASTNSYTATGTITDLDYRETYIVQLYAQDKVQTVYSDQYKIHKATPVFDWSEEDFNLNVPTYTPALVLKGKTGIYNQYPDNTAKDVIRVGDNYYLYIGTGGKSSNVGGTYVGGNTILLESNTYALIDAPSGVFINSSPLSDFVVEQGESGYWFYRKWNSGLCEMWGWCQASYQQSYYLSSYQAFPVALTEWISANGTLNAFSGNLAAYLGVNVKVECMNTGCNVWVQNPSSTFEAGATTGVSLHIVGKWK